MTDHAYTVTLGAEDGAVRDVRVVSPTDVQAGDAARSLMEPGETILRISRGEGDDHALVGSRPVSQAAELASVTPGMAAAPEPGGRRSDDRG